MKVIRAVAKHEIALKWMKEHWPDVIITDIEFPSLDGISFIKKVQKIDLCSYIIFSSLNPAAVNSLASKKQLSISEIIKKPKINLLQFLEDNQDLFLASVKSAAQSININIKVNKKKNKKIKITKNNLSVPPKMQVQPKLNADAILPPWNGRPMKVKTEKIVVIGASTGGIQTIEKILVQLPEKTPGIVIVQHLAEEFTYTIANHFNSICKIKVKEMEEGDKVESGLVLITPGRQHSLLKRIGKGYIVKLNTGPPVKRHKPSVDVFFEVLQLRAARMY